MKKKKEKKKKKEEIQEVKAVDIKEEEFVEVEVVDPELWKIRLARNAYETMLLLARYAKPSEVQMLAEVERKINTFIIDKVHLIKQVADAGSASFDNQALAVFVGGHAHPERVRGWVHSHVEMGNFWSHTDEATIVRLVKTGGWLVSIVMCVDGQMRGRVDVGLDAITKERIMKAIKESKDESYIDVDLLHMVPMTRTWDNIPVEVEYVMKETDRETLKAEFEEKVQRRGGVVRDFQLRDPYRSPEEPLRDKARLFGGLLKHPPRDMSERPDDEMPEEELSDAVMKQCDNCEFDGGGVICEKGVDRKDFVVSDSRISGKCPVYSPIDVR